MCAWVMLNPGSLPLLRAGTNEVIMAENANDYGHTHRNNHMSKAGEFVMFADDDNYYTADALATVRAAVQHDPDGLFIFQLEKVGSGERIPSPGNGEVEGGNVDTGARYSRNPWSSHALSSMCLPYTPRCLSRSRLLLFTASAAVLPCQHNAGCMALCAGCGVVPTQYAHHGRWESAFGGYGADGVYFGAMAAFLPRTYMFNKVRPCGNENLLCRSRAVSLLLLHQLSPCAQELCPGMLLLLRALQCSAGRDCAACGPPVGMLYRFRVYILGFRHV